MIGRFVVTGVLGGVLFGILDGLINGNPLAVRLYEWSKPVARTSMNLPAAVLIDLVYGFIMAALFLLLYRALPGDSAVVKGLSYGAMVWFFRVVMSSLGQWVIFAVPLTSAGYGIAAGLAEMLILGAFIGLLLGPVA